MRWIALSLLLTVPTVAQAPPDGLDRAMQALQVEIDHMRAEVKALKDRQAREDKARELRQLEARRRAQLAAQRAARRVELKEARRLTPIPKPIVVEIKSREEQIKQSELILAQLNGKPSTTEAQKKVIADLVIQRNEFKEKIRRQNNRRLCRWFRIGCIGRK